MKNVIIYLMASLALFACQNELEVEKATKPGKELLRVSVNIPEYRIATRAASFENNLSDVWLLAFDRNGLFLERVQATELSSGEADGVGSGSFKAEVPEETGIIHVVANYDNWSSFNDNVSLQKDEKEVMPSLYGNKMVFWGRSEVTSSSLSVTLFRNQAKVTVQNEASNFTVTGYALGNMATSGTVVPFMPEMTPNPFIIQDKPPRCLRVRSLKQARAMRTATWKPNICSRILTTSMTSLILLSKATWKEEVRNCITKYSSWIPIKNLIRSSETFSIKS